MDAEELREVASHTDNEWLKRIATEIKTIRILQSELLKFYRAAEQEVPEYMRRFANYMHDLHDIAYMYEERGIAVPQWLLREMERCDDRMRQLLKTEHSEGVFGKIRAGMVGDEDNRWDHSKQLTFKKEGRT